MKKFSGILAVSLLAIMTAPAARADIASTTFVTNITNNKQDTLTSTGNKANVTTKGGGNVVTGITATNGAVEVTTGKLGTGDITDLDDALAAKENVSNKVNSGTAYENLTAAQKNQAYPTVGFLDSRVSEINTDIGDLDSAVTQLRADIDSNTGGLPSKQPMLTTGETGNIKGDGIVSVTKTDGVITVSGSVPVATDTVLGGVKSGGNITVADNGTVTVNQAANATTADSATKAAQDGNGKNIADTYATQNALTAETNARTNADKEINDKIGTLPDGVTSVTQLITNTTGAESQLAKDVAANTVAISAEKTRAEGAEKANADAIKTNTNAIAAINDVNTGILKQAKEYADTAYTLPTATADVLGGVKSGGDISVDATNSTVTVNHATNATNDGNGNNIAETYQVKGSYVTVPAATGTQGISVLTYNSETKTYYWENIGR